MSLRLILVSLCALALVGGFATINFAEETTTATTDHQYVGASGCKGCHSSDKMGGTQYTIWADSKHAKAYEVLGTDAAKEVAAKAGVEGNPQEADACLKCHVTAWGVKAELKGTNWKTEDGVECESCHGAGKDYMTMATMKDMAAAMAAGLLMPDEETCLKCHNEESPTFKEFKYDERLKAIKHWEDEDGGE